MSDRVVVYDTMVYLQAAIRPDRQFATFEAVEDKRLRLCTSPETMAEVADVFSRPTIRQKFPALTPTRVAEFIEHIWYISQLYERVPPTFSWPEHPDDDHVFNLAIHARARYLVTCERRIIELPARGTPASKFLRELAPHLQIVSPAQLASMLKTLAR